MSESPIAIALATAKYPVRALGLPLTVSPPYKYEAPMTSKILLTCTVPLFVIFKKLVPNLPIENLSFPIPFVPTPASQYALAPGFDAKRIVAPSILPVNPFTPGLV